MNNPAPKRTLTPNGLAQLKLMGDVFAAAVSKTIEIQGSYVVQAGKPFTCDGSRRIDESMGEIAAVLGLIGNKFSGTIAIFYGKKVYLALIGAILRTQFDEIEPELEDGAGEILNMIFGTAKGRLDAEYGYKFQSAIPTIIRGPGVQLHALGGAPQIAIPFTTKDGPFELKISISHETGH